MRNEMADFRELGPTDPIKEADHVLVVKHDNERFEVSGTAGADTTDARFLTPAPFEDKDDALVCAQSFAQAHGIAVVHVKGFRVEPEKV